MIKIDKTGLFRSFIMFESFFVGIPIVVYWSAMGFLYLAALSDLGLLIILVPVFVLFLCSFYFILPGLIVPKIFKGASPLPILMPRGLYGWLLVVGVYSALAFILAAAVSLYIPLKEHKKSIVEHTNSLDRREGPTSG